MHELSIALRIVEMAAARCRESDGDDVAAVTLRVGRLAAVHPAALEAAFEIARAGSVLRDAVLRIVEVPVRVWCDHCGSEADLDRVVPLACPSCGRPTGAVRAGRDLELESIELRVARSPAQEAAP